MHVANEPKEIFLINMVKNLIRVCSNYTLYAQEDTLNDGYLKFRNQLPLLPSYFNFQIQS